MSLKQGAKDLISRYFMGENVQIVLACTMFLTIGLLGAKFYEKMKQEKGITDEEKSSYYTREQLMRFVAYVFGIAPLVILIASFAYGYAGSLDKANGNHRFVYLLYAFVGFLGIGFSGMIMSDISKFNNKDKKSSFSATAAANDKKTEKSETQKAIDNAKMAAIAGLVIFALHFVFSVIFAVTANTDEVFSLNAFNALKNYAGSKGAKSSSPPPTNVFGMNDLLSFGRRRRRY